VVAHGVGAKHVRFEFAAAYQRDAAVNENVTLAQPPQLHAVMLSAGTDGEGVGRILASPWQYAGGGRAWPGVAG
jgi:hypothetical protein